MIMNHINKFHKLESLLRKMGYIYLPEKRIFNLNVPTYADFIRFMANGQLHFVKYLSPETMDIATGLMNRLYRFSQCIIHFSTVSARKIQKNKRLNDKFNNVMSQSNKLEEHYVKLHSSLILALKKDLMFHAENIRSFRSANPGFVFKDEALLDKVNAVLPKSTKTLSLKKMGV